MIHDNEIVPIEILLDRGLAEFAQRPAVPVDAKTRMKRFVF